MRVLMSRNGCGATLASGLMIRIVPTCSTAKSRFEPSPELVAKVKACILSAYTAKASRISPEAEAVGVAPGLAEVGTAVVVQPGDAAGVGSPPQPVLGWLVAVGVSGGCVACVWAG